MKNQSKQSAPPRKNRKICILFSRKVYNKIISDAVKFRNHLNLKIKEHPELFPKDILSGYQFKDSYISKKLGIITRRIKINKTKEVYTIHPSFVMHYMTGLVNNIEKVLFLRKFAVPFWALAYVFGRNPLYWFRIECSLGRNSIVGTTFSKNTKLPEHAAMDEKHTKSLGKKIFIAVTASLGCILGVQASNSASQKDLTDSYGEFKKEALNYQKDYSPKTINTDSWPGTRNALKALFPNAALTLCFLHVFIKIRDRIKKKTAQDIFKQVAGKLWNCYNANTKRSFSQRARRFCEWMLSKKNDNLPEPVIKTVNKFQKNLFSYSSTYDYESCYRTSNIIDRLIQRMKKHIINIQYFHGSLEAANLSIRSWALIHNFAPFNPRTIKQHNGWKSPAERINQFRYCDNWLENLLISASMGGYKNDCPQNP